MRCPLAFIALAFGAGIGLRWTAPPIWVPAGLLAAAVLCLLRVPVAWRATGLLLLILAMAGFLRAELEERSGRPPVAGGVLRVDGVVHAEPSLSRDGRRWNLWFRVESPRMLVQARLPAIAGPFERGERLRITGQLRPGRPAQKSGRFDERRWLWVRGAAGVLSVGDAGNVERLSESVSLWSRYLRWTGRLKRALSNQGRLLLGPEEAGLLEGLLLAEGRGIRPETWDAFRKTGTVHVLVVSGSHVGLIGLIGLTLLTVIRTPRSALYPLLAGMLVTYCALCGASPPILRATLAGLLVCWAKARGVPVSPWNLWGAAAAAILAWQPRALADAGFQLSFSAVAGLLVVDHWMKTWSTRYKVPGTLVFRGAQAAAACTAAWAATVPLTLWHFHSFSLAAPLANLVAIPWASLLISAGFLLCGAGLLLPAAAPPLASAFTVLSRGFTAWTHWTAGLPGVFLELSL